MTAGPDFLDVTLAQQSGRRAVVQLWVESLHPGLRDPWRLCLSEHRGHLKRYAEPLLYRVGGLPVPLRPLVHSTRLAHGPEICDQAGA